MKRLLSILLTCVMALSLAACGDRGGIPPPNGNQHPATETVTIKIMHNMDFVTIPNAVVDAGKRLNERYAAEGKGIVVEFDTDYQRIDWREYQNNVIFSDKSGDGPDIYTLDSEIIYAFYNAGVLMDISELMTDAFVDGAFDSFIIGGRAYAMPFDLPVRAIYHNREPLRKIGWTEDEINALPKKVESGEFTFEDFMALCEEVTSAGVVEYGMMHRPGYGNDFLDVLETLGGSYHDGAGKLVFEETGISRFFRFIYDNANVTKISPPNMNQMGWDVINSAVGRGDCFAYYGPVYSSTYVAMSVDKTPAELAENVQYLLFPKSDFRAKPGVTAAPSGMGINPSTKHPEVCLDLLREVVKSPDLMARHGGAIFSLSSVKAANEQPDITHNPILQGVVYMARYAKGEPALQGLTTYTAELHKQIVQLELGLTDPDKATSEFKAQLDANLTSDQIIFK